MQTALLKINSTVDVETGIVNLELPDRILQFDTSDIISPTNLFDLVGYGSIVKYYIENDKYTVTLLCILRQVVILDMFD